MATKDSVLKALEQNRGTYLSGEELSASLDISRTSVWKAIKALRSEGHHIEAVTNKGYMLVPDNRLITQSGVREGLSERHGDIPVHVYDEIDSTNLEARRLMMDGASGELVVIARQQTAGRGRLGRGFFSPREGIYLSVVIRPDFDLSRSVLITSAAAVAVCEAIEEVTGSEASIKWVNDVYVDGRKVCGILTEGVTDLETGRIEYLIIGIGVNTDVSNFPPELRETAGAVEGDYSAAKLAGAIASRTLDYARDIEARTFIDSYRRRSIVIGKDVTVYKGRYKISPEDELEGAPAVVLDIDDDGRLLVEYEDGSRDTLSSGEITIRF